VKIESNRGRGKSQRILLLKTITWYSSKLKDSGGKRSEKLVRERTKDILLWKTMTRPGFYRIVVLRALPYA